MRAESVQLVLIADLDGTLITPSEPPGPGCQELIAALGQQNGVLVPSSARPIDNIARVFSGVPAVDLVSSSGGGVIGRVGHGHVREVLHEESLTLSAGAAVFAELQAHAEAGHGVLFEFADSSRGFAVTIVGGDLLTRAQISMLAGKRPIEPNGFGVRADSATPRQALGLSFLARATAKRETAVPDDLGGAISDLPRGWRCTRYPEVRMPGWQWLEVLPERAAKGPAADRVVAMLTNGSRSPIVVAAGDAPDDVQLLSRSAKSWCPSTAADAVKIAAEVLQAPGGDAFARALAERIQLMDIRGRE
jgi:hydroxymethylpyrimidine pyrophosphatase-like HAD family hydrolase